MQIKVDYEQLFQEAADLKMNAQQYEEVIQRIDARMYEMQGIWQGEDNQAFIQQLENFRPQLKNMGNLIESYASYLNHSASCYQRIVQDRIQKAKQLA